MNHVTDTKLIFYQPKLRRVSIQKTKTKKKIEGKIKTTKFRKPKIPSHEKAF